MATRIKLSNGDKVDVDEPVESMGDQLVEAIRSQGLLGVRDREGAKRLLNPGNIVELLDSPGAGGQPAKPMD